jgi:cell division protein FtsZ
VVKKKKTSKQKKPSRAKKRVVKVNPPKFRLQTKLRRARKNPKKLSKQKKLSRIKKQVVKVKKKIFNPPKEKRVKPREIDTTVHRTKIRVIGIGGGGSTIVSEITSRIKKADFYVANTDNQALRKSGQGTKKFQFGQNLTRGLGTGMNAELGEQAAQNEEEKIKKLLEGQDLCIMIASLGGGTSSGASPVFAKISKNLGNITYGIFTLPFEFEGEKKMEMAKEALEKVRPYLNVYTVIPNERIFQIIDKNTPLKDALSAINKRLADNLEGLIEMIYLPGLINIDFADLETILAGRGRLAYLDTIEVEGPNKEEAIKKLISSPFYPYTSKGARGILYNITSGNNIQLSEVNHISKIISDSVNRNAKIIFGINQGSKYGDKTKITLLATGCLASGFLVRSPQAKPKTKPLITAVRKIKKKIKPLEKVEIKLPKKKKKKKLAPPVKTKKTAPKSIKNISKKVENKKKTKPQVKKIRPQKIKPLKPKKKTVSLITKPSLEDSAEGGIEERVPLSVPLKAGEEKGFGRPSFEEGGKIRKNALQVRKEAEEAEKEILEQEKIWEIPAILRRKK